MFPFPFSFSGVAPVVPLELIDNNFAMEFNGTDEYTSAPNSMSALTGLSVSAWVYPTSYGIGALQKVLSVQTSTSSNIGIFHIGAYNASNFRITYDIVTTNGATPTGCCKSTM